MNTAILYIASPFQLLCAINAIRDFEIKDYKLYLLETDRVDQTVSIAEYFNLEYEIIKALIIKDKIKLLSMYYKMFFKGVKTYDYLFIGDIRAVNNILRAFNDSKICKSIVYLDDGNVTLSFFANKMYVNYKNKIHLKLIDIALSFRKVIKYYYTIYDISSTKYIIKKNPFKLIDKKCSINNNISLFVGSNSLQHAQIIGYTKELYLRMLNQILKSISKKYQLIYIAHGRETLSEIKSICEELNIKYIKPNKCIEMYLIENNFNVVYAYGFGSTALYNIKKMYPNSIIKNIFINSKLYEGRKIISKVYKDIGIQECYLKDFED